MLFSFDSELTLFGSFDVQSIHTTMPTTTRPFLNEESSLKILYRRTSWHAEMTELKSEYNLPNC